MHRCIGRMLVEPNPWTNEQAGGYLLNEVMVGNPMVRNGDPTVIQGKAPLAFLNKLQRVAYTINSFVYDVAEEMDRRGYVIGKFNLCLMLFTGLRYQHRLTLIPMKRRSLSTVRMLLILRMPGRSLRGSFMSKLPRQ